MSLITRDFLGNHHASSKQLLLPDLKSERNHMERCRSMNTNRATNQSVNSKLHQDLNQPPLNLWDDTDLELNLVSISSSSSSSSSAAAATSQPYTLGKVKLALERAEKEYNRKHSNSMPQSLMEKKVDDHDETYAAGCPSCLLYVLISSKNPKCPRCNMTVPYPTTMKKPRIDLNITM